MKWAGATRPLLPLAAVTAGLASGSSLAAEWTMTPSANLLTQAQQNPRLAVDDDSKHDVSSGLGLTAGLGILRRTERTTLSVSPLVRAYRYDDNNNLDRDEEALGITYGWVGETVSWDSNVSAARDTTLTSELGTTGLTQGNLRHESWDVSVGPSWQLTERWRLRANAETYAHRYPDRQSALLDYGYSTAMLSTSYVASEKLVVSLFGTAGRLNSDGNTGNTDDKSANVQLQYSWSLLTSFGAAIGRSWVTSDTGESRKGLLFNLSASHVFEKSSLSFNVSRRQAPSGRALLTEADEASVNAATQITERLSATATASYSKRRNVLRSFNFDLQEVRYTRAQLGLAWVLAPNWKLGFAAGSTTQQVGSDFVQGDLTGRGFEVSLGLSWNGDPYVR